MMMPPKNLTLIGLMASTALLLPAMGQAGAEKAAPVTLDLVRDGKPAATIVMAGKPTRSAQLATAELQYHVRKITGATLPIVSDGEAVEGTRILVGHSKATAALGLTNDAFEPQEYAIRFLPKTLVLVGRDKLDYGKLDYNDGKTFPSRPGSSAPAVYGAPQPRWFEFDDQATCYAVYDFLERYCGVRWYLPTELGLVCPETGTLRVTGTEVRRRPAMDYRYMNMGYQFPADLAGDPLGGSRLVNMSWREQCLFYSRMRMGGKAFESAHSLSGYYRRFLEDDGSGTFEERHPEYFARGYGEQRPERRQMCFTDRALVEQVARDARDFFDGKGDKDGAWNHGDSFFIGPIDNRSWCKCPNCRKLIKKKSTRGSDRYFTDPATDYLAGFVNEVAREVGRTHPDKWIGYYDYGSYAFVPERVKLEPNVWVSIVLDARNVWCRETQRFDDERLAAWAAESPERPKMLHLWYCFPAISGGSNWHVFPGFFAHSLVRQMKKYHEYGIAGFTYESSKLRRQSSPILDQLACYLTFKLADDPTLDGNKLIDEFFERYYGPAAEPMQAFYEIVEKAHSDPANYPPDVVQLTETIAWGRLGTGPRMEELGRLMAAAKAAARTEIEKQRVALFDRAVWQRMLAGRQKYVRESRIRVKAAELQQAVVPRLPKPLAARDPAKLDWSVAGTLGQWRSLIGEETTRKLDVRLAHDGSYLYLRLIEHLDPGTLLRIADQVWDEDEWELFLARSRGKPYRQMGVNANGVHIDLAYPAHAAADTWDSGAVVRSDTGSADRWTVYIALPLAKLLAGGVEPGQTIYLNIIRSGGGKVSTRLKEALAWNPTLAGYHEPERFGRIVLEK